MDEPQVWMNGMWFRDIGTPFIKHIRPGFRNPMEFAKPEDIDVIIDVMTVPDLIKVLESGGYLTPRLDERLRSEDLKITHRLLDIIQGKAAIDGS